MEHDSAPLNWYETLNVPPHATVEDIRQAYKVLMHQYHPDKVASLGDELKALAERKSKEITNAYRQALQLRGEGS
jgi:DnaJ like chaperone protein